MSIVTGNIGNENVTLRNIATEDTLDAIYELMRTGKAEPLQTKGTNDKLDKLGKTVVNVTGGLRTVKKVMEGLGVGAFRIVRGLESNIDNVNFTFSTIAGELRREGNGLAKLFTYVGESVSQLQEQQNAFSRMVQVGGTMATEFDQLGINAAKLGVDLRGMAELTDKFAFSLKIGNSTVGGGLRKLTEAVETSRADLSKEFGRLGIAPQKIAEQLLLAAEAEGGFGDVMKRYGGDAKLFSKGMLKSTQELNIFATAIGSNSRLMMEETAKAAQKITNRIFFDSLSKGEKNAVKTLQVFTGSAETAFAAMRSFKGRGTTLEAGMFQALKGYTGMNNEIEKFIELVSEGKEPFEALEKSGLMAVAKAIPDDALQAMSDHVDLLRQSEPAQAALLDAQLTFIKGVRDTKPEDLKNSMNALTSTLDPKTGTLDALTGLQNQQIKLAGITANVNSKLNRFGLALGAATLKGTTLGLEAAGKGKDAVKSFFNNYLKELGINVQLPDDIFEGPIEEIEKQVNKLIDFELSKPVSSDSSSSGGRTNNLAGTAISGSLIGMNDQITYKDKTGKIVKSTLSDLLNNPQLLSESESFKGRNNRAETLALGAALQKNITTLSAVTAGDDNHPKHQEGAHPAGRGLDFAVDTTGKDPKETYRQTEAAIRNYMKNVLKLDDGDFSIKNELDYQRTGGTGPHMHVEITESASTKIREKFKMEMAPKPETQRDSAGTDTDRRQPNAGAQNSSQPLTGTVNNNMSVTLSRPEWLDGAIEAAGQKTTAAIKSLEGEFNRLSDVLKRHLQK